GGRIYHQGSPTFVEDVEFRELERPFEYPARHVWPGKELLYGLVGANYDGMN
ncbi:hypothetical protein A2U01_0075229, partial [Trifolium medium]|nr:hypothetical protein [Trifolium medium]